MLRDPGRWVLIMGAGILFANVGNAQIETLVMPGKLIEGHADIEEDCSACHQAFNRSQQRELCLDCHEDVAADVRDARGFHGRFGDARNDSCANCHTDHEGRDANIVVFDEREFDHDFTDFALAGSHRGVSCSRYRDAVDTCFGCHEDSDTHGGFMGTECADCHTPAEWLDVEFDHDTTDFPLLGRHRDPECLDCHADQTFQNAETTCFGCHQDDDTHDGRSGEACDDCHSPVGWEDLSFSHNRDTEFRLDGRHAALSCSDCHSEDPFDDGLETGCVSCHQDDDHHEGHFGDDCATCHTADDWPTVTFDHDVDTDHPLQGAHRAAECQACHLEPIYDKALASDCLSCHQEDDAHEGTQGEVCIDCHNQETWEDDVFFDHDLTAFPLLGSHTTVDCGGCHDSHVFTSAPGDCASCHRDDDPHEDRFSDDCAQCHNPVDWQDWAFDHNRQTEYPLRGAHLTVVCEDCHRGALNDQLALGNRCGNCHRADDVHDGEFGFDCGRCHSDDTFLDARTLR